MTGMNGHLCLPGYSYPKSPLLLISTTLLALPGSSTLHCIYTDPAFHEKEKAFSWQPTNYLVWQVPISSPAVGQIFLFQSFSLCGPAFGRGGVVLQKAVYLRVGSILLVWYEVLGWSVQKRWAAWQKTLRVDAKGSPSHPGTFRPPSAAEPDLRQQAAELLRPLFHILCICW